MPFAVGRLLLRPHGRDVFPAGCVTCRGLAQQLVCETLCTCLMGQQCRFSSVELPDYPGHRRGSRASADAGTPARHSRLGKAALAADEAFVRLAGARICLACTSWPRSGVRCASTVLYECRIHASEAAAVDTARCCLCKAAIAVGQLATPGHPVLGCCFVYTSMVTSLGTLHACVCMDDDLAPCTCC